MYFEHIVKLKRFPGKFKWPAIVLIDGIGSGVS